MSINIRFKYRLEDFKELLEVSRDMKIRKYRSIFLLLGLAVIAVPFINGYTSGDGFLHPDDDALPLILLGVMLLIGGIATPQKQWLKVYVPYVDDTECEATIDDNGVITTTPTTRNELRWAAFDRTISAPNVSALVSKSVMYAFPKRAFSEAQWAEFTELIKTRVGNRDSSLRSK